MRAEMRRCSSRSARRARLDPWRRPSTLCEIERETSEPRVGWSGTRGGGDWWRKCVGEVEEGEEGEEEEEEEEEKEEKEKETMPKSARVDSVLPNHPRTKKSTSPETSPAAAPRTTVTAH